MSFWAFPSVEIAHKYLCPEGWCCNNKEFTSLFCAKLTCLGKKKKAFCQNLLSHPVVQSQAGWDSEPSLVKTVPARGREVRTRSLRSFPTQNILWFYINFWPVLSFHSCLSPVCGSSTDSWRNTLFLQEPNSWQSCCLCGEYTLWRTEQHVISSLQQSTLILREIG